MITAVFTDNSDYARATGLWQWDYGQRLRIEGLKLPTAVEIHFALAEFAGDAITRVGTTKDGVTEVVIPDSLLENQAAGATYEIYAWIYLADKTSGETIKRISVQVKCRPKPEGFDTPEDAELFRDAIEAVNASADRAETAREGAEAAQRAAKEAAGKIEGEITGAGQIAEQVRKDAEAVAKDKQAVSQMVTETTQNAQNAASGAQAAESFSTAAKEAQTAAESAEAGAAAAMEEVERDRTEVSETHRAVEQLRGAVDTDRQAVAADRRAVENTVTQFGQVAQNALTAVGQAQEAAVGAVSDEGQRQATAVQQAGTHAVSDVETAKTTAVQAVTTEGDTQVGRVQDAAAGIVADREQIAANKQVIEALHQNKADAIVETAQGETVTLTDSSDKLFRGLRVFGKSTQAKTTGAQLFDVTNVDMKTILNIDGTTKANGSIHTSGFIKVSPNTTYSVSKTQQNRGKFYNLEKKPLTTDKFDFELSNNGDKFTTLESVEYVRFSIYETVDLNTLMMNQGDTLKPYEPYSGGFPSPSPDWEQPILNAGEGGSIKVEVTGRNLIDGKRLEIGGLGGNNGQPFVTNTRIRIENIKIEQGKIYSLGFDKSKYVMANNHVFDADGNRLSGWDIISPLPDKAASLSLSFRKSDDSECFESDVNYLAGNIILNEGTSVLPYEPYTHQSLTLATPNGLPGVPVSKDGNYTDQNGQQWVCDEVDLERGKYVQRVAEKDVLESQKHWPGTGLWGNVDGNSTLAFISYINGTNGEQNWGCVNNAGMCNYFVRKNGVYNNSEIGFSISDYVAFRVPRSQLPDWDESNPSSNPWINWLRKKKEEGKPLKVQYILTTPIERDLTPEELAAYEALHTNYPITVITNDAGAHMETSYVADTKAYINKKFEELNQAIVKTQIALL